MLGVGIETHNRSSGKERTLPGSCQIGQRSSRVVRFMERKCKRTSQEGSIAMSWMKSVGLLEVGSVSLHVQTDSQI